MIFADSIILLGLWVLIMVDGHWVSEICWVGGKAFFFFFLSSVCFPKKVVVLQFFFFFSESEKGKRETFGVAGFGVVRFDGGANSLGMKREMKMKKRSSNGNNSAYSRCDNALAKGPTTSSNLPTCH